MRKPNGLLLLGGKSSRMGEDKAFLTYNGETQLERAFKLLTPFCENVFISCREDQLSNERLAKYEKITDTYEGKGPLIGILSAFKEYPDRDLLVLACDMPFVDETAIRRLLDHGGSEQITAFLNQEKKWPEPLCTLYKRGAAESLLKKREEGFTCPRKIIMNLPVNLIEDVSTETLFNTNKREDYECASRKIEGP